ncbi:MAG: hypothetical protein LBG92_03925, partial [Prevotellaceae bacterium]|nr:hypothetical protein [Prevotellaceae bacterium]
KDRDLFSILQISDKKTSAKKIKFATGWERGADGKWRYETEDIELNDNIRKTGTGGINALPLGTCINDNKLFSAYPELKAVMVEMNDKGESFFNSKTNTILPCAYAHGYKDTGATRLLAKHRVLRVNQNTALGIKKQAKFLFRRNMTVSVFSF